jgi:hypothetical protein
MASGSLLNRSPKTESYLQRFLFGGFSCMCGSLATNPIDVIKVRLQIQGELSTAERGINLSRVYGPDKQYRGFIHGLYTIARTEGVSGLYKGLTASLLREATYSTLRIGFYDVFKDILKAEDPKRTPLWKKIVAGALAGALGAAIANPTDLVKVRLQASASGSSALSFLVPNEKQRVSDFQLTWRMFAYTFQKEGVRGLYRGVGPTTQRAALLTAAQLGSYDHIKHFLLNLDIGFKENSLTHFTSLFCFLLSFACTHILISCVRSPFTQSHTFSYANIHNHLHNHTQSFTQTLTQSYTIVYTNTYTITYTIAYTITYTVILGCRKISDSCTFWHFLQRVHDGWFHFSSGDKSR